ncbi:MAG: SGNH/GDSL hydrolase family protein [Planctomycetota bacterium]|nr:SGNH/GDSL hydrolase family protein [Planctomycetota bacterium]
MPSAPHPQPSPPRRRRLPTWAARLLLLAGGLFAGLLIAEVMLRVAGIPRVHQVMPPPSRFYVFGLGADGTYHYVGLPNAHIRYRFDSNPRGYFDPDNSIDHVTNARGLRGFDFPTPKPPSNFRIVFLGDSFTFGDGVRLDDTFPQVAARLLNQRLPSPAAASAPAATSPASPTSRIEALNFGVGGYNTTQELYILEKQALATSPDLVVLAYVLNDAEPPLLRVNPATGQPLATQAEGMGFSGVAGPQTPRSFLYRARVAQLVWQFFANRAQTRATIDYYQRINRPENPGCRESMDSLRKVVAHCRERNIPCCVMLFPIFTHLDESYPFADVHARLAREVEQAGGICVDLLPWFKGMEAEALWVHPTDHHPNEKGHAIAAQALVETLVKRHALSLIDAAR